MRRPMAESRLRDIENDLIDEEDEYCSWYLPPKNHPVCFAYSILNRHHGLAAVRFIEYPPKGELAVFRCERCGRLVQFLEMPPIDKYRRS